jgi:hypothetical protein
MAILSKKLSTGDVMVFNKEVRELVLIPPAHAQEWEGTKEKSAEFAKKMAQQGHATLFTRQNLGVLQSALAHIIHLE